MVKIFLKIDTNNNHIKVSPFFVIQHSKVAPKTKRSPKLKRSIDIYLILNKQKNKTKKNKKWIITKKKQRNLEIIKRKMKRRIKKLKAKTIN